MSAQALGVCALETSRQCGGGIVGVMIDAVTSALAPRRARRWLAALLAGALACSPLQAQVRLPALGESASDDLPISVERRLGEQIMRDIRRDPDYLDDPVLLDYLQALWQPLVAAARQRGDIAPDSAAAFAWESFLVRDRGVNAFALPGGYVGVYLGLIALTTSSYELASVLAHELAHVTQRHIARSVGNSQRVSLISVAALLLGVIAASRSQNSDMAQAAVHGGQAVAIQGQLNFSRDMEREADRIGFGLLTGAGFASAGMAGMFDKLESANRLNDNNAFPYLRSHPLTVDRIAEARARTLLPGAVAPGASPLRHRLMQARARVLMDPGVLALRRLQEPGSIVAGPERITALYASALASSLLREPTRAEPAVQEALRLFAALPARDAEVQRALLLLLAQVQLADGQPARALLTLNAPVIDPSQRPALLLRAQAALDAQRGGLDGAAAELRRSTEALQTWTAEHRNDAGAWTQLALCAEAAGLRLRSLRAHAEARAALGDLSGAIDRLRAGQDAARGASAQDFIEVSVIDARLRDLLGQRRVLAAELRAERGGRGGERPD